MLNKNQKKNQKRRAQNKRYKTLIKNQFKKITNHLNEKNSQLGELKILLAGIQKVLDKAANEKVIHKNKAARKKSKLHKLCNQKELHLASSQ